MRTPGWLRVAEVSTIHRMSHGQPAGKPDYRAILLHGGQRTYRRLFWLRRTNEYRFTRYQRVDELISGFSFLRRESVDIHILG